MTENLPLPANILSAIKEELDELRTYGQGHRIRSILMNRRTWEHLCEGGKPLRTLFGVQIILSSPKRRPRMRMGYFRIELFHRDLERRLQEYYDRVKHD